MSEKCRYSDDCKEFALFSCSCTDSLYLCEKHISSHMLLYGSHVPRKLYTKSLDDQKSKIIEYLVYQKNLLNERVLKLKKDTCNYITYITSESNNLLKDLRNDQEKIEKQIRLFINRSLVETEIFKKINEGKEIFRDSSFYLDQLKKTIKNLFDPNCWRPGLKDDEYVIFFKHSGKYVDLLDLKNFKKFSADLKIFELAFNCCCLKIGLNRYFVYGGGTSNPRINSAKIIDIKNKTSEMLPTDSQLFSAGGCLVDNEVFVFGGHDGNNVLSNCKKFSLEGKVWKPVLSLPEANSDTTTLFLNNKILVLGYQSSKCYSYNPKQNEFTVSQFVLNSNSYKFFIDNWIVCFSSCIYEINDDENLIIRQLFTDTGNNLNSSAYFKRDRFLYFVIYGPKLYRINLDTKTISFVSINY